MELSLVTSMLYGILGGLVRAAVGLVKYFEQNQKGQKVRLWYLLATLLVSAVVGALAGALAGGSWQLAVVAGYAGTDFLEGLYKIRWPQGWKI